MVAWSIFPINLEIRIQPGIGANMVAVPAGLRRAAAVRAIPPSGRSTAMCNATRGFAMSIFGSRRSVPLPAGARRHRAHRARCSASFFLRLKDRYSGPRRLYPDAPPTGGGSLRRPGLGWSSWCARPAFQQALSPASTNDHTEHRPRQNSAFFVLGVFAPVFRPIRGTTWPQRRRPSSRPRKIERLGYGHAMGFRLTAPPELSEKRTAHQHVRHTTRNWRIN